MTGNTKDYADAIVDTMSQPLVVLTSDLNVERVNSAFCKAFDVTAEESEGHQLYRLGNGQWRIPKLRRLLEEVLSKENDVREYRVEHDFESIGRRVMLLNARRMNLEDSDDRIVLAIDDRTRDEQLRHELEGRIEFAEKLIDSVREGLLILDWDLHVHSANQSFYEMFDGTPEETEGKNVYDLGNGQWDIPELRELLEDVLPSKLTFNDYEVEHEFDGLGRRIMSLNGRRLDHLDLIILAIRDVTDDKDEERRQKDFMRELQHRVKNVLANVRSLANLTRQRSATLDDFLKAFLPRLEALSRAQQLLVDSPKDHVELAEIVRVELDAIGAQDGKTCSASGASVWLNPRDAQAFAMAVHELATNAGKYGALAIEGGHIEVRWERLISDDSPQIVFSWRERGVAIPDTERSSGFGTAVIEKSVPHMLGGTSELMFHPDGVECKIVFQDAEGGRRS